VEQVSGAKHLMEYALLVDVAKQIAMVEGNEKGKQARTYFIECERQLNKPLSEIEVARRYLASLELIEAQRKSIEIKDNQIDNMSVAFNHESQWLSILKVAKHNGIKESLLNWRPLKSMSAKMGYEVKKMPSRRYEFQNIYHINVFKVVYPKLMYGFDIID
jgi:hypothetical protein